MVSNVALILLFAVDGVEYHRYTNAVPGCLRSERIC